jgi:hypothetical protein
MHSENSSGAFILPSPFFITINFFPYCIQHKKNNRGIIGESLHQENQEWYQRREKVGAPRSQGELSSLILPYISPFSPYKTDEHLKVALKASDQMSFVLRIILNR